MAETNGEQAGQDVNGGGSGILGGEGGSSPFGGTALGEAAGEGGGAFGEIGALPGEEGGRPLRPAAEPRGGWWWGTGRRKRAVARVRIRPSEKDAGVLIQVSGKKTKKVDEYFTEERDRNDCFAPLKATGMIDKLEVVARCGGGGFMGQAQAVRLGIARALRGYDPTLEQTLRDLGYLTRDSREVERKKYGLAGARRRFQFSKR